jgi:uridine kinase
MGVKIIGIGGGSGSGKTTIVRRISEIVPDFTFLAQDSYYKSAEFVDNENITAFNFDHPSAFDTELMVEHLRALRRGETIEVVPRNLVIFEGIMIFVDPQVRELLDLKLYVDTPDDIRFIRRLKRDITERGRTMESVITQYLDVVRPGHFEFIEPTKSYADLIIPEGGSNEKALEVLTSFMQAIQ